MVDFFFLEIGSILEMRNGGESGLKMKGYKECEGQSRAEVTHKGWTGSILK